MARPEDSEDAHPFPLEGVLDLHTFRPEEAVEAVEAFLEESRACGWKEVRIVHGKGMGTLRTLVHTHLRSSRKVKSFRQGNEASGGWGATLVELK